MRPHHAAPEEPAPDTPASHEFAGGPFGPFEIALAGGLDAPTMARAALAAWLEGQVDEPTLADAQLVAAELVGNSVRHADTPDGAAVSVRVEIRGDVLHLAVHDVGMSGSVARRAPDLQHGGGFGLNVVEALSRRWGVARVVGTRVWVEIGLATAARCAAVVARPDASPRGAAEERLAAALVAQTLADGARGRARAARHAGDRATTEYARRSHDRVADMHVAVARHHEEVARRLRLRSADGDPDPA